MSFRELRTFTETMRMLGYERTISVESFRTPNVELVADIMYWLVRRYDPATDIVFNIDKTDDRVVFFRRVCEAALAKARIRLNMKKLYQADGYAVQELLKLANLLKQGTVLREENEAEYAPLQQQIMSRSHQEAKITRQLCSDLTTDGNRLFHLVESEMTNRGARERILTQATEIGDFERRLRDLVVNVSAEVDTTQNKNSQLTNDQTTLEGKIDNKKAQLERQNKRLKSLQAVRPAFMEEFEKFEAELHQHFVVYLEQYRNLEYLESLLAKYNKIEDELLAEQETRLRVMREKLRKEELKVLRGDVVPDDGSNVFTNEAAAAAAKAAMMNQARADNSRGEIKRPRAASGRTRPNEQAGPSGFGGGANPSSMVPPNDDDSDDDDDSDAGDSDDDDSSSVNIGEDSDGEDGSEAGDGGGSDDSDDDDDDDEDDSSDDDDEED